MPSTGPQARQNDAALPVRGRIRPRTTQADPDPKLMTNRRALRHRRVARPHLGHYRCCAGEVGEWQNRPLDALYPLVFFDAIRVKIRDEGFVRNKGVYIALGILPDGTKEILAIWIEQTRARSSGCAS